MFFRSEEFLLWALLSFISVRWFGTSSTLDKFPIAQYIMEVINILWPIAL